MIHNNAKDGYDLTRSIIQVVESLDKVKKKNSSNKYEKGRYEPKNCLLIVYTTGRIVVNPHKNYLKVLEKYYKEYDKR